MRIVINVIDNSQIVDKYEYSNKDFLHNNKIINIKDKNLSLVSLISKTAEWETNSKSISKGFYIEVSMEDYFRQYYFENTVPDNFTIFWHQVRKIALGDN